MPADDPMIAAFWGEVRRLSDENSCARLHTGGMLEGTPMWKLYTTIGGRRRELVGATLDQLLAKVRAAAGSPGPEAPTYMALPLQLTVGPEDGDAEALGGLVLSKVEAALADVEGVELVTDDVATMARVLAMCARLQAGLALQRKREQAAAAAQRN